MIWWHDTGSLGHWLQVTFYSAQERSHLGVPFLSLLTVIWGSNCEPAVYLLLLNFFLFHLHHVKVLIFILSDYYLDFRYQQFLDSLYNHFAISVTRLMIYWDFSVCLKNNNVSGLFVFHMCLFIYFELKQIKNFMPTKKCIFVCVYIWPMAKC